MGGDAVLTEVLQLICEAHRLWSPICTSLRGKLLGFAEEKSIIDYVVMPASYLQF